MIVPMSKYTFIIHHSERQQFIEDLMDLGVVHVQSTDDGLTDQHDSLLAQIKIMEKIIRDFDERLERHGYEHQELPPSPLPDNEDLIKLLKEKTALEHKVSTLKDEVQVLTPWGNFDWSRINTLEEKTGLNIRFYQYPKRSFKKRWQDEYRIKVVNKDDQNIYFMAFALRETPEFPVVPMNLPGKSLEALKKELSEKQEELKSIEGQLDQYALTGMEEVTDRLLKVEDQLTFYETYQQLHEEKDGHLYTVSGYCPSTKKDGLLTYLKDKKVVYIEYNRDDVKDAPVLLKNNRFNRLFEPIGNLFSLPSYSEMDMTLFFAPFFFLFFGFCLGDAGYGLILLVAGTIAKYYYDSYRDAMSLLQLFGISTAIIGFFSGTFFGLELVELESMEAFKSYFLSRDELFNIALIIGFVQILFGLALNAYKRYIFQSWKAAMSRIGWMFLLVSLVDIYITSWMAPYSTYVLWLALALIIFFGAPEKGWVKSIGLGLVDLYNITGILGDILSYIRLFALGVSSAILGLVINSIAMEARGIPYAGFVVFLLILIVGHTANLALAGLSAFVHPMRLTFVEFYKNAGFDGGGKAYNPIKRHLNHKS